MNVGTIRAALVRDRHGQKRKLSGEVLLLGSYLVLCVFFVFEAPYFLSIHNFLNIGVYSSIVGVSAVGMTLVLLTGEIDISVGAVMSLVGIVIAELLKAGVPLAVVVIVALAVGGLAGILNGLLVTKVHITSLIVTLATMAIFTGLAYVMCGGLAVVITSNTFGWFGTGYVLGIPVALIIMVVFFAVFSWVLRSTKFGRRVYAAGGNAKASYLSGINVNRVKVLVFTLSGITAGVSGLIIASQTGSGLPDAGTGLELNVIAAAVLGGTSLAGGRGRLVGTFLGVVILTTLVTGLTLMNVPAFYQQIVTGIVLLLAVTTDSVRRGRSEG